MKKFKQISIFGIVLGLSLLIIPPQLSAADSSTNPSAQATQDQQAQLEQQLQQLQTQIDQYQQQLNQIGSQKNTLSNKIKQLQTQKNKITAQVQQTNLNLSGIKDQLSQTQDLISQDTDKINTLRSQIGDLLPTIYDNDQKSTIEILLSSQGFIGFYQDMQAYQDLSKDLHNLLTEADDTAKQLSDQQSSLNDEQDQQQNLLNIQSLQNEQLADNISDQNTLLTQTKGQESAYQSQLKDTQAQAAQIQNRLYELFGVGTNQQVTFGQAVSIAEYAGNLTGVRAAFLLAILTQESNLGKNVGTCNRPGDPPSKSYKVVMNPTRDIPPFLEITADLGLDPNVTPISCPGSVGWGGAMGPAQFIPSTWMGYKDKVAALTGKPANPWDIRDAFVAASIKLAAGGATTQAGEWAAAMRYFSGGTNPKFSFYGDSVVAQAAKYQSDIDELSGS